MANLVTRAQQYLRKGWRVVPIPNGKKPAIHDWPNLRLTNDEIPEAFSDVQNIGLLLGEPSGGLVDVDLDAREAALLAPIYLPATSRTHGRESKKASHFWYVGDPIPKSLKLCDCDGKKSVLVELRSTKLQTVVPPSIHQPSGERMRWEEKGTPATVDGKQLQRRVFRLGACALAARHWPSEGRRHECAMALAGVLLRNGWPLNRTTKFVQQAARVAGDDEWEARGMDVRSTAQRLEKGQPATGIPRLAALMSDEVVRLLRDWLEIQTDDEEENQFSGKLVNPWPDPPSQRAYYGLAGEIVRAIEPHSEADPAALLVQLLVAFGDVIGRRPHFIAEADRHGCNMFAVLVGCTSKGRKGSSWSHIRQLFEAIEPDWTANRVQSGLSSGEGLIWAVRDPTIKQEALRKKKIIIGYQQVVTDEGVEDKRLLALEPEFASVLRTMGREGNTLSALIRQAWDRGLLRSLTKNSPAKASNTHIALIGHITRDELRRYLDTTEAANGFANRFVWAAVRRSKSLPEGGRVNVAELEPLINKLRNAVKFARGVDEIRRSEKAKSLWGKVYENLSKGRPGLLGAVVSRAEAQVARLAVLFALLDNCSTLREVHLKAALALWRYLEASARFIFGDSLGDPLADELLKALRNNPDGLTRTNIRDLFHKNRNRSQIDRALEVLLEQGLARQAKDTAGEGRPAERWIAMGTDTT